MSTRAAPSIWNAVEMAIRGAKRSSAHSSTASGSSPSNSTESSPASSSSMYSPLIPQPPAERPCRRLFPLAAPRGLEAGQPPERVVVEPARERRERLAGQTLVDPALDEPDDGG